MAIVRPWYNASSNDGSSCVDTQFWADGMVQVRNSKSPGQQITFTNEEWTAFVQGVMDDKFRPVL